MQPGLGVAGRLLRLEVSSETSRSTSRRPGILSPSPCLTTWSSGRGMRSPTLTSHLEGSLEGVEGYEDGR